MPRVRIALADDHDLVRAGIRALLERLRDIEVVAEARNGEELLSKLAHCEPDIVITDLSMPTINGFAVTREIARRHPSIRVLVLSVSDTAEAVREAVECGAVGYMMKTDAPDELERAIQSIVATGIYFGTAVATKLLQPAARKPHDELTERQIQVLVRIAKGKSAKEIGYDLGLSPKTVDVHRARIMERLQVRDIAGLTRYAVRMRMVEA